MLFLALFLGAVSVTFNSCTKDDPCKDVTCGDHGSCFEGSCVCDEGYELGADAKCSAEIRAKFIGNYNCTETCVPASSGSYSMTISAGTEIKKMSISNFGDSGLNVTATLDGTDKSKFNIDSQTLPLGGTNFTLTGSGTVSASGSTTTVNLNYAATEPTGTSFTCTVVMTR